MHALTTGLTLLLVVAILFIGTQYLRQPRTMMRSFGLALPSNDANTMWWLRLKGVRDIASGLTLLALLILGPKSALAGVLFTLTLVPLGDMTLILASKGSTKKALGIHAPTAVLMVATAILLIIKWQ